MITSMTAFARQERQGAGAKIVWELRSVNHRYLELAMRLPDEFRFLEGVLRERAGNAVRRGKVDCTLRFQAMDSESAAIAVDQNLLRRLLAACAEIDALLAHPAPISAVEVLRWPGIVQSLDVNLEHTANFVLETFDSALSELTEMRAREGARLQEFIAQRAAAITEHVHLVRTRLPDVTARIRQRLSARLAEFTVTGDNARLEQELVLLAQKMDIEEELDRLASHLQELAATMKRSEPVGRRLDFLTQELNREANTLGSKSADADTTRTVVGLKVLIEQIREQVQNIE